MTCSSNCGHLISSAETVKAFGGIPPRPPRPDVLTDGTRGLVSRSLSRSTGFPSKSRPMDGRPVQAPFNGRSSRSGTESIPTYWCAVVTNECEYAYQPELEYTDRLVCAYRIVSATSPRRVSGPPLHLLDTVHELGERGNEYYSFIIYSTWRSKEDRLGHLKRSRTHGVRHSFDEVKKGNAFERRYREDNATVAVQQVSAERILGW